MKNSTRLFIIGLFLKYMADAFYDKKWNDHWSGIYVFNSASTFVAKYNNGYTGFIISFIKDKAGYISVVVVKKEFQNKGIGTALLYNAFECYKIYGYR